MREISISKTILSSYINEGLTTRQIGDILGKSNSYISYLARKYGIEELFKYKKPVYKDENYFHKIDSKEKAYILGFLIGDGTLTERGISCSISLGDREILDFIKSEIDCNIREDLITNLQQRKFPSCRMYIGNKNILKDIKMLFAGNLKEQRRFPIIKEQFERYLIQGFFDAEGCLTWGKRKDRNRLWHKFSFTSKLELLNSVQNILLKNGISSKIYPKKDSNCFVLESTNKDNILKFLNYLYYDKEFIILQRKYNKAKALRLELGELGET